MLIYNIHNLIAGVIIMSIGTNIKDRRLALRMSQQELADIMGYKTRSTIAKIESGENDVSQKKLIRFAEALDTTVEVLIAGEAASSGVQTVDHYVPSHRSKNIALILAGGKLLDSQQNIPTQFVGVHGKPLIVYCLEAYQKHPSVDDILIVCLKGWEKIVKDYADQFDIKKLRDVIPGGATGAASLENACRYMEDKYSDDDLIIIQEATRPLVRAETISSLLRVCEEEGSGTICHSMNDYVQFDISTGKAKYVDRNAMIALQSPEAHRFSLLKDVFAKAARVGHLLTESCCTMLMHELGFPINFVRSPVNNIKIVRAEDIAAFSAQIHE